MTQSCSAILLNLSLRSGDYRPPKLESDALDIAIVSKIVRDLFRIDYVAYTNSKIVTFACDNDRSFLYNGTYYSPLIDTLEDDLRRHGIECQSVARLSSNIKGSKSYGNVASPDGGFARALLQKRLKKLITPQERYPYSKWEERVWDAILEQTGAEKIVGILPSRELCNACHRRGIWVADIQHGVISETHPWYGQALRSGEPAEWAPDAFLCWDQESANVIDAWAEAKGSETIVAGNRWLSRFIRCAPDDTLVNSIITDNKEQLKALSGKPTILVSLSWGCSDLPNGFMADGLRDAICETSSDFNWLLRLHPNQLIGFASGESVKFFDFFEKHLSGHAAWQWASNAPLPVVLDAAGLHISWNSSVAIEASLMGIKSALLDPQLRSHGRSDYYANYQAAGFIDLVCAEAHEIIRWLDRHQNAHATPESFVEYDRRYDGFLKRLVS